MLMVSFNSKSIFNGNRDYNNITVSPDKNAFVHLDRARKFEKMQFGCEPQRIKLMFFDFFFRKVPMRRSEENFSKNDYVIL